MKPTQEQITAGTEWAMANRHVFCDGKSINWATLAEGILTAAQYNGVDHVFETLQRSLDGGYKFHGLKRDDGAYDIYPEGTGPGPAPAG